MSTLFECLPPSNSVLTHASTISNASPLPRTLSPNDSIFALLCAFDTLAENTSDTTAHLIPGTLLAAKDIPIPVPQHTIP